MEGKLWNETEWCRIQVKVIVGISWCPHPTWERGYTTNEVMVLVMLPNGVTNRQYGTLPRAHILPIPYTSLLLSQWDPPSRNLGHSQFAYTIQENCSWQPILKGLWQYTRPQFCMWMEIKVDLLRDGMTLPSLPIERPFPTLLAHWFSCMVSIDFLVWFPPQKLPIISSPTVGNGYGEIVLFSIYVIWELFILSIWITFNKII